MVWCCLPELDLCAGLVLIILYGLTALRHKHVRIDDVHLFCGAWPVLMVLGSVSESVGQWGSVGWTEPWRGLGSDLLLCVLTLGILMALQSFESQLLILLAYVGQLFMLQSCCRCA